MVFNLECIKSKSNQIKIKEFPNKIKFSLIGMSHKIKIKEFPNKIKEFPNKIKEFSSNRNLKKKKNFLIK